MHPVVGRHPAKPRKSASHSTLHRDKDAPPTSFYTARSTNSESYSPRPATSASQDYLSFPSFEAEADMLPKHSTRQRCRTGPTHWIDRPVGGRISVASTVTEGTPPDTPIDNISFKDLDVLVAAPVSRVEMMDALVDGMNGGDKILSSRSRFDISNHHPLYHPPLPTPPPGVVLGSAKTRSRPKKPPKPVYRSSFSDEDDDLDSAPPIATPKRGRPAPIGRPPTNLTDTSSEPSPTARPSTAPSRHKRPSLAPSISEIIRAYASPEPQSSRRTSLSRTSSYSRSAGHSTPHDPDPGLLAAEEESELLSRSSIDSIADEIQQTLRRQASMTIVAPPPPPLHHHRQSFISDSASIVSPRSDGGGAASIYSASIISTRPPLSPLDPVLMSNFSKSHTSSQAVAHYLRSARLTTLLKLTRSPHASHDLPLTVSLSDLGSQNGFPVLVFLGLGCVRHIMGLYDEMAQCLGLRLITIDRWGLGRTEPRAKSAKGIMQWASVVEEVLDLLHIDTCSVMAHSAGAPYALSFANKVPHRIRGDVCLLAPWVGENGGYKWLKYVPNGILKTAQAAEWKLQTWMIGKPPTMAWEGIGYTATKPNTKSVGPSSVYPSLGEAHPRPSMASSAFSAYDDLKDFEGRFESISTLGTTNPAQSVKIRSESRIEVPRKSSRSFLGRLKSPPPYPDDESSSSPTNGKRLKGLRSMGSLKSRSSSGKKQQQRSITGPQLPPAPQFDVALGLDDESWTQSLTNSDVSIHDFQKSARVNGRRSMSLTASQRPKLNIDSLPPSPNPTSSAASTTPPMSPNNAYQAALGNALLAASHAESSRGTHNDLLQILNHDHHPWGFSYEHYPHKVQVWYGDRDEKIAENAVRWLEKTMGEHMCSVKVVNGADHGLMYKSAVVVEVLEFLLEFWH